MFTNACKYSKIVFPLNAKMIILIGEDIFNRKNPDIHKHMFLILYHSLNLLLLFLYLFDYMNTHTH